MHVEHCHLSKAGVMVLSHEDPELDGRPVIRVENPRRFFVALLELFRAPEEVERTISPMAYVYLRKQNWCECSNPTFAVIEDDAEVGDGCIIYPHAYVGKRCKNGC